MQLCYRCKKPFCDGDNIIMTCEAVYHSAGIEGIHAIDVTNELDLFHEACGDD